MTPDVDSPDGPRSRDSSLLLARLGIGLQIAGWPTATIDGLQAALQRGEPAQVAEIVVALNSAGNCVAIEGVDADGGPLWRWNDDGTHMVRAPNPSPCNVPQGLLPSWLSVERAVDHLSNGSFGRSRWLLPTDDAREALEFARVLAATLGPLPVAPALATARQATFSLGLEFACRALGGGGQGADPSVPPQPFDGPVIVWLEVAPVAERVVLATLSDAIGRASEHIDHVFSGFGTREPRRLRLGRDAAGPRIEVGRLLAVC